jgi:hypothetical protein
LAVYQVVTEQDGLEDELATLTREWSVWIAEVGQWTPGSNEPPPERPTWRSAASSEPFLEDYFSGIITSAILIPILAGLLILSAIKV